MWVVVCVCCCVCVRARDLFFSSSFSDSFPIYLWRISYLLVELLMIGDLNDFILPAQACINPFVGLANSQGGGTVKISADATSDLSQLEYESDKPGANVIKAKTKDNIKVASISLTDCLACRF